MPKKACPKNTYLRDGIYWARFKVGGVEYRQSLRTRSERVALKRLAVLREQVEDQAVYGIAGPVGWPDAVVSWSERASGSLGERSYSRYLCSLRQVRAHLDSLSVQEVTAEVLKELIKTRRRAGVKNATIRRDLTAISSVLDNAADEGWISDNPVAGLNRRRIVPEKTVRIVLPQDASVALVFERLPDRIRDLCEFTRETGLRLDEATSLRHAAIDRLERTITVEKGKGDKVRVVPLTAAAEAIADRQPRYIGKPWVFWQGKGERIVGVSSRLGGFMRRVAQKAAREGTEFHPFSHHDFRHLFAVEYLRSGRGSIYDLQGELGHGTITVTERYLAFLTPDQVKAAKSLVAQRGAQTPRSEAASTA
ncbi:MULTISPECIES: tyrosine-type recombinase/integrase [Sphingomonas]|uniref:Tyrosine-type recombinase/integrase n=1 Tax=Sphingomonas molluscorum TaxID=418184 RepID=A0ABU8Q7T4_9SPHN|nr:tyrosine-type recombinase/integrase [Sphingomonas sp. JUb134]MBM7407089.1 integrase/recombinase XerD [Sphingomonas sp. JUb134]